MKNICQNKTSRSHLSLCCFFCVASAAPSSPSIVSSVLCLSVSVSLCVCVCVSHTSEDLEISPCPTSAIAAHTHTRASCRISDPRDSTRACRTYQKTKQKRDIVLSEDQKTVRRAAVHGDSSRMHACRQANKTDRHRHTQDTKDTRNKSPVLKHTHASYTDIRSHTQV